ncbi:MAG: metallophosphoesterase [Planctomycetota bacterium]
MTRRSALLLALTLFLGSACAAPPPEDPATTHPIPRFEVSPAKQGVRYLRALVIGDFGYGHKDQHKIAEAMVTRTQRAKGPLDLLITTGDNFYPAGVESADDPGWKTKFEDVYKAKELQTDIRPSLGNHDWAGKPEAQVEYGKTHPRWKMPARYYTFSHELDGGTTVQFFALDTTPLGFRNPDQEQLAWLERELAASKARWKVVFGHHPLYSYSKRPFHKTLIERIGPLFEKHKVDLYMAGHDHVLELLKPIKGVHHLVSGAAGGPAMAYPVDWPEESYYAATNGGFVWLRVSKDELVIEFVRMKGETQFAHTLYKRTGPF